MRAWKQLSKERIFMYVVSIAILFALLYFAFIETTALVYIPFFITPIGYVGLCILVVMLPFFQLKKTEAEEGKDSSFTMDFLVVVLGAVLCYGAVTGVQEYRQQVYPGRQADAFAKTADEFVSYGLYVHHDPNAGHTKDPRFLVLVPYMADFDDERYAEHLTNVLMVDYDEKTVAFFHEKIIFFAFDRFQLEEGPVTSPDYHLQVEIPLALPGAVLRTYYLSEEHSNATVALQLTLPDGGVYSVSDLQGEDRQPPYLDLWAGEECLVHPTDGSPVYLE